MPGNYKLVEVPKNSSPEDITKIIDGILLDLKANLAYEVQIVYNMIFDAQISSREYDGTRIKDPEYNDYKDHYLVCVSNHGAKYSGYLKYSKTDSIDYKKE